MKLHAIVSNGTRLKDFVDIHYFLERLPLKQIVLGYSQKYPDVNYHIACNGLLHHTDIDFSVPIKLIKEDFNWNKIKNRLRKAVAQPHHIFSMEAPGKKKIRKKS